MPSSAVALLALCPLLAAQSQPAPDSGVFSVRSFGAAGDGTHLDTAAISAAIKAAAAAGGGVVVFPPGRYLTGTFELLSNVSLDLKAGSVILGSPNLADYGSIADYGFAKVYGVNSSGEGDKVGMIVARQAENIAIFGQGAIDGNSAQFFDFNTPHIGNDFDARYTRDGRRFWKSCTRPKTAPSVPRPTAAPER